MKFLDAFCIWNDHCFTGGLFFNVWQWVTTIYIKNLTNEMQSNFAFFVCVWLLPMILFLNLEVTWMLIDSKAQDKTGSGWIASILSYIQLLLSNGQVSDAVTSHPRPMSRSSSCTFLCSLIRCM